MYNYNIQLFAENPAQTTTEQTAGAVQTPEQIEADRLAKEQAALKAKEEAEKQRNAEEARKRRERERQEEIEKAKKEARVQTIIETVGVNPYTQKPIVDEDDVETYMIMKKIEAEKGDPIKDFPDYVKRNKKEIIEKQQARSRIEEQARKDIDDFQAAHPDVKVEELLADEDFKEFSEGKLGTQPLTKIYDAYIKFVSKFTNKTEKEVQEAQKEAQRKAAEALARKMATPGPLNSTTTPPEYFTKEQIDKMSVKEIQQNLDKVNKSLEYIRKKR